MKKSRVTIRDVALVARVTPQTVSRAIRNAPEVSAETREKVLKVAAELNYVKNNSASSLRCGNSKLIVIVYDHLVNIYFSIMIDYLQTCFREQNYSILMLSVTKHQLDRSDYEFAISHNVAGIVSFLEPDKEVTEMLDNFAIPVLLFGRRTDIKSVDYICMDDEEGGRLAARRFVEKGCTSSVYVSVGTASCAYDRFMGFKKELESAGAKTPRILDSMDCFEENFSALFENSETVPDSFFCFSDMVAFDVIYRLEKMGIKNAQVIGFDDIQKEVRIPKRLISVGTDKRAMAQRAVNVLVSRIEEGRGPRVSDMFGVYLNGDILS
ncbi:MAG: LacI family DNA-binding transcriptional regulator [Christensenellaceae bacterium]